MKRFARCKHLTSRRPSQPAPTFRDDRASVPSWRHGLGGLLPVICPTRQGVILIFGSQVREIVIRGLIVLLNLRHRAPLMVRRRKAPSRTMRPDLTHGHPSRRAMRALQSLTQKAANRIRVLRSHSSSCPALCRASTSLAPQARKTWMAGTEGVCGLRCPGGRRDDRRYVAMITPSLPRRSSVSLIFSPCWSMQVDSNISPSIATDAGAAPRLRATVTALPS